MKKIIISSILILALLMSFAACQGKNNDTPKKEESVYDLLNRLTKENYSKIQVDTKVITDGIELNASYVVTKTNVTYSIEQLNLLPSDGITDTAAPTYKTTISGTATVENGKISKLDGEVAKIPAYSELKGAFNFKENYFKNVKKTDGKFSADVKSASDFLGTDKVLKNLKVEVEYQKTAITKITLTYKALNSTVTTVYSYQK